MSASATYEPLGLLGVGGMAEVHLVRRRGLGDFQRLFALKRILAEHDHSPRFASMFIDEARLVAHLRHPGVVQVFEVGRDARGLFYVMEYVEGMSLSELLRALSSTRAPLPLGVSLFIVECAARGLHYAHLAVTDTGEPLHIVHRDASPSNILLSVDGDVKVADFGVARAALPHRESTTGQVKGKYGYMSPEQCRGEALDPRSDVFALGILLYEVVTGRRLYVGDGSTYSIMDQIIRVDAPRPSASYPDLPPALDVIVARALCRDREGRTASALELANALRDLARQLRVDADAAALATVVQAHRQPRVSEQTRRAPPTTTMPAARIATATGVTIHLGPPPVVLTEAPRPDANGQRTRRPGTVVAAVVAAVVVAALALWATRSPTARRRAIAAPRVEPSDASANAVAIPTSGPRDAGVAALAAPAVIDARDGALRKDADERSSRPARRPVPRGSPPGQVDDAAQGRARAVDSDLIEKTW